MKHEAYDIQVQLLKVVDHMIIMCLGYTIKKLDLFISFSPNIETSVSNIKSGG